MKYERLTKNGSNYATCDSEHDIIVKFSEDGSEEPIYDFDSICVKLNRLADLEDKIESGILVNLPCKLGQVIYAVYDGTIHEYFAEEVNVHEDGRFIFETPTLFPKRLVFGKEVFTDKSQAEARLKELQGE